MAMASPPKSGPVSEAVKRHPRAAGLALIITNDYKGTKLDELTGTHKDGQRMKDTFESIGFAAVHKQKVSQGALQKLIHEATQEVFYPVSYKSICFVFSGHGNCDTVEAKGTETVLRYLYNQEGSKIEIATIVNAFMPKSAKRIGNIPKAFFIDACRGTREMCREAVTVPKSGGGQATQDEALHHKGGTVKVTLDVPPLGNYLIAYSTIENYQSYEVKKEGGIWMNALSRQLREKAGSKSLSDILTDVNEELMELYQDPRYKMAMTQPDMIVRLNRTLYLIPNPPTSRRQNSLPGSQEATGGTVAKSGESYKAILNNDMWQKDSKISKPEYTCDRKMSEGYMYFLGHVTFTVIETGKKKTFSSDTPEKTKQLALENAAKQAVQALRGLKAKSLAAPPKESGSPSVTTKTTVTTIASSSGKPPTQALKEHCEKNKLEPSIVEVSKKDLGEQRFQFKATVKTTGGQLVAAATGEVKRSKREARNNAAEAVLHKLCV